MTEPTWSDDQSGDEFIKAFCLVASFQGRVCYGLMSIYAVNPSVFEYFSSANPYPFFLCNMIYGITVMINCRRSLRPLLPLNRFMFSLLGSLAFNYSSLLWFHYLSNTLEDHAILRTFLGFFSGRVFMVHLLAFLYHIDSRSADGGDRLERQPEFEIMYS